MNYDKTYETMRTFPRPLSSAFVPHETRVSSGSPWVSAPVSNSGSGSAAELQRAETRRVVGETGWQNRLASPQFVAHPYLRVGETIDFGSAIWESPSVLHLLTTNSRINGKVRLTGPLIGTNTGAPSTVTSVPDFATTLKTEAVAKAKSGALQALVTLMEGPKTLTMLANTVGNLAHLVHVARRRLAGSTKEVKMLLDRIEVHGLQDGVSAYLQWRYGWRVLLLEIKAAFEALAEAESYIADAIHRDRDTEDLGGEVTSSVNTSHSWSTSYYCAPGPSAVNVKYRREVRTQRIRGSAVVYYLITEDAFQARNLNLSFAPTLWELIPYSFVYDWFTNVGSWLTAYATAVPGLTWQGGVYSELIRTEITYTGISGSYYGSPLVPLDVVSQSPARHQKYRFERALWNPAEPLPPVVFNEMTLLRALDAVALVTQRLTALSRDAASWRFKLPRK